VIKFPRADELPMGIEGVNIILFFAFGTDTKKISGDEYVVNKPIDHGTDKEGRNCA
jgi:hypothetical protein